MHGERLLPVDTQRKCSPGFTQRIKRQARLLIRGGSRDSHGEMADKYPDGQLVTERALSPGGACLETEISLAHLPAGLYHVALYEQGRLLAGGRVILQ